MGLRCTIIAILLVLCFGPQVREASAATGCSLDNPQEDLALFFPDFSHFTVRYLTFANQNPEGHESLGSRLGGALDKVYETVDVPYTLYSVYDEERTLGYVFGTNQRGTYSNIQVIAAIDATGSLQKVYIQKIRSPKSEDFLSQEFLESLAAHPLDLYKELSPCFLNGECTGIPVNDPTAGAEPGDYRAILRGMAKLGHIRELLLKPGQIPNPPTKQSRAEYVSLLWVPEQGFRPLIAPKKRPLTEVQPSHLKDDEPVAVVIGVEDIIIYPISLLTLHPIMEDTLDNSEITIAWSSPSYTLNVLKTPSSGPVQFSNSNNVLYGHQTLLERKTREEWCPILGTQVGKPTTEHTLDGHARAWVLPWKDAYRAFPNASVAYTDDGYSKHASFYLAHKSRFHEKSKGARRLVATVDGQLFSIDKSEVAAPGVYAFRAAGLWFAVVSTGQWFSAYALPELGGDTTPRLTVQRDLVRGFPLFSWGIDEGTWQGTTGIGVSGTAKGSQLEAIQLRELPVASLRAFLGSHMDATSLEPQARASLEGYAPLPRR